MGRHSKPSKAARAARRGGLFALSGIGATALLSGATTATANADTLDVIAQCESGGRNVPNSSGASTASGYFQIINGTWIANGGRQFAPTAMQATYAEQRIVAERIAAARGSYADWNASRSCWGSKVSGAPSTNKAAPTKSKSTQVGKKKAKPSIVKTTGRGPDGRGTGVCTPDKLFFEACDPGNLGEVFQYPKYDKR